jgi:hypothetical protein
MGNLTRSEKRIIASHKVSEICRFIGDEADEKRRCKILIETLRILHPKYIEQSERIFERLCSTDKLPKNFCGEIGRDDNPVKVCPLAVSEAADMVRDAAASDGTALLVMYDWLQSDYATAPMLSSLYRENGVKFMEILVREKPGIVCHLLQQGRGIYTPTLKLLEKVAEHPPDPILPLIISDILEDCAHSERWKEKANRILKIANIVNPVNPLMEIVRVDTAYFINWGHGNYFSNPEDSQILDLIGELSRLVTGSPTRECCLKSTTSCRHSLCEILRISRTIDLLMFLPQGVKRYRGHDIHQFNVAALGLFFLDTHVKNNIISLGDYLASVHQDQFPNPCDVKNAWLLASLLHDHALPISHMFKIAPLIYDITGDENLPKSYRDAVENMQRALKLTYADLFSGPLHSVYHKFATGSNDRTPSLRKLISKEMLRIGLCGVTGDGFDHFDHGLLAATNMTSRFKNTPLNKMVETSARAVAVHSLHDKKISISFKKDPLTFLLVLCDELQEWGREIADFPEILMDISSMKIGRFDIRGGKRFFGNDLRISFRILKNDARTKFDPNLFDGGKKEFFKERLDFDDPNVFPPIYYGN